MRIKEFIQNFYQRKGLFVLLSILSGKVINFVVAIVIIRILAKAEYGLVAYSMTIISFFAPFVGAGIHQSFLRFGALSKGQVDKKVLFDFTLRKGIMYSLGLIVLLLLISPFLLKNLPEASWFLWLLSFQLIGLFLFQMIGVYCRLIHRNKIFSIIEIQKNLLLLITNIGFCLLFGAIGYIVSMILVPLVVGIYYIIKLNVWPVNIPPVKYQKIRQQFNFDFKTFFAYGIYMSLGGVLSQLLFAVDVLLIGYLIADAEQLAQYKASSIIPFSLIALSVAVITTDFVKLTNSLKSGKHELLRYYWNYLKIFSLISLGIVVFFYSFSDQLLGIFGSEYKGHPKLMIIFAIGVAGALLLRTPLGNMLSVIGWPRVNALISGIILIINLIGNYFMIKRYGIEGAAITTSSLMWLSGIFSLTAFLVFQKRAA